jgi:protease PrsW
VILHAAWDTFDSIITYVILGVISLTWLLIDMRRYRTFQPHARSHAPAQPLAN